jgi:hypothetical protein
MQRIQVNAVKALNIQLLLRATRQVDESRFAGAVTGAVRDVDGASPGSDIQNTTAALFSEAGQEQSHEVIRSMEVDCDILDELSRVLAVKLDSQYPLALIQA